MSYNKDWSYATSVVLRLGIGDHTITHDDETPAASYL